MKALYGLVFVLFSFAASAQTLEASIAEYFIDDLDCSGETTQQSTPPARIIAPEPTIELLCEAMLLDADGVEIAGDNDAEDVPVGAIQPSDESPPVEYSTRGDGKLTEDDTIEQSTMPAQIVATEPTIEKLDEAVPEVDGVAITGPDDAEDVTVGAARPSDENPPVEYSTRGDGKLTEDDTIGQSTMPAQIVATEPTIDKLDEAVLELDGVAITGPGVAENPSRGDSAQ